MSKRNEYNSSENFVQAGGFNGVCEAEKDYRMGRIDEIASDPELSETRRRKLMRRNLRVIQELDKQMAA